MAIRTTTAPARSAPAAASAPALSAELIARRAYEKWCERGCPHGTDVQDWHAAEAELKAEQHRGAAPSRR
jgi:hypothetical protein